MTSDKHQSQPDRIARVANFLDWLTASSYNAVAVFAGLLVMLFSYQAFAIRYTWRAGLAEPETRLQYALVQTFADLPFFIVVFLGATLLIAFVKRTRENLDV